MRKIIAGLICIVFLLSVPLSVNADTADITEIIRKAQAQAVREAGSLSEITPEYVMERSKEIIAQEYGAADHPIEKDSYREVSDYEAGYDDGYAAGYKAGQQETERRIAAEKEEMRNNRIGAYFSILFVVAISVIISVVDKRKQRR